MRLYVSGPMTGLPEFNYPLFNRTAARLREDGHEVYNPAEYEDNGRRAFSIKAAFKEYTAFICDAEGIYMLSGWESSKGARAEHALAVVLGLVIVYG